MRQVFGFDSGAQALRLSGPAGSTAFMTLSAALCDTVPRFKALPRFPVALLPLPPVVEEKNSMSENPTGGSPGTNRRGPIATGAA